ncbi:hypothetical protein ScPMuIL_013777 [Solemya velum]
MKVRAAPIRYLLKQCIRYLRVKPGERTIFNHYRQTEAEESTGRTIIFISSVKIPQCKHSRDRNGWVHVHTERHYSFRCLGDRLGCHCGRCNYTECVVVKATSQPEKQCTD